MLTIRVGLGRSGGVWGWRCQRPLRRGGPLAASRRIIGRCGGVVGWRGFAAAGWCRNRGRKGAVGGREGCDYWGRDYTVCGAPPPALRARRRIACDPPPPPQGGGELVIPDAAKRRSGTVVPPTLGPSRKRRPPLSGARVRRTRGSPPGSRLSPAGCPGGWKGWPVPSRLFPRLSPGFGRDDKSGVSSPAWGRWPEGPEGAGLRCG
jgi:hypothetical protein